MLGMHGLLHELDGGTMSPTFYQPMFSMVAPSWNMPRMAWLMCASIQAAIYLATLGFTAGCTAAGGTRIDNFPMYGQPEIERPAHLKQADEAFLLRVDGLFDSREKASQAWFAEGERFMSQGNLDYAMRRYNQSWLLDPDNYQPYWGFARVLLEQGKLDDAIRFFEKAEAMVYDPYQKVALLSDMGSAYTYKGKQVRRYFSKANEKFSESTELDPDYENAWHRWALSLYEQGDYLGAWEKVSRAEKIDADSFSDAFIKDLEREMPRPRLLEDKNN